MIDIAGSVDEVTSKSPNENLFIDVADIANFEQQPTTSQESGESTSFHELFSNYTENSQTYASFDLPNSLNEDSSRLTTKFPAYKWECTLPDNIVDHQNRHPTLLSNGSTSQRSPTYSLNLSANSSPMSIRPTNLPSKSSIIENESIGEENRSINKFDSSFESIEFAEIISIFDDLIRDSQLDIYRPVDQLQFDYTSMDGTIVHLETCDFITTKNPNPMFCRIKTQAIHNLLRIREQVYIELGKLLNESIDKENFMNWPLRNEHKLTKRLSNSIRKARRLSSYGYKKEIFGRSLTSIRASSNLKSPFPVFIHQILVILLHEAQLNNVEGLLRTSASKNKLDEAYKICSSLSANDQLPAELCTSHNVYILADLIKRYLREIPESLLPQHVWHLMIRCFKLDGKDRLTGLQYCVLLLNSSQREALFVIVAFLLELSYYQQNTLMDLKNLITVILPNIIELGTIDPMEQSSKCKSLVEPLKFVFEHIFDIMCMPMKMLYNIDEFRHKSALQVALNNFAFNVNYSILQKQEIYWQYESMNCNGIVVKSKVNYNQFDKKPLGLRAEVDLKVSSSAVFAYLNDNYRYWSPIFATYKHCESCEDEEFESIKCKTHFSDKMIYLKRYNGRIYDSETQTQLYVLFQKQDEKVESNIEIYQLSILVYPIDVYNSKVIFVLSISSDKYGTKEAASVLSKLKDQFEVNDFNNN